MARPGLLQLLLGNVWRKKPSSRLQRPRTQKLPQRDQWLRFPFSEPWRVCGLLYAGSREEDRVFYFMKANVKLVFHILGPSVSTYLQRSHVFSPQTGKAEHHHCSCFLVPCQSKPEWKKNKKPFLSLLHVHGTRKWRYVVALLWLWVENSSYKSSLMF